jgi:hypothetical protein
MTAQQHHDGLADGPGDKALESPQRHDSLGDGALRSPLLASASGRQGDDPLGLVLEVFVNDSLQDDW